MNIISEFMRSAIAGLVIFAAAIWSFDGTIVYSPDASGIFSSSVAQGAGTRPTGAPTRITMDECLTCSHGVVPAPLAQPPRLGARQAWEIDCPKLASAPDRLEPPPPRYFGLGSFA